jgi:hypothetical protein
MTVSLCYSNLSTQSSTEHGKIVSYHGDTKYTLLEMTNASLVNHTNEKAVKIKNNKFFQVSLT